MDYTDIIPVAQQYVNVKAVALSVLMTQLVKYWLPSPCGARTAEVIAGTWYSRALPFLPIMIGIFFCTLVEPTTDTVMENTIRGIFTGAMGAYGYRTAKVSILGG